MSVRQDARPRRLVARYPLSLAVSVRGKSLPSASCPARNVSVGGMFLSSDTRPELFSELQLAFSLPNGRNLTLVARVVHVLAGQKARELGVAPGFGVQFAELDALQQSALHELVAWARARDPRPRIARRVDAGARSGLQQDPMLSFLLDQIDGQRDPEALAEELALDVEMVERMLAELKKRGLIELSSARELSSVHPPTIVPPPRAAGTGAATSLSPMPPALARELAELEARLPTADHYQLLGLDRGASAEEIRAAFKARDASLHPSIRPPAEAQRLDNVLGRVREAYSALSSPERRAEYDEYLRRRQWLSAAEARISIMPPPPDSYDPDADIQIPRHDKPLSARDLESTAPATRPPPSTARSSRADAAGSGTPVRASASESNATGSADAAGSGTPARPSMFPPSGAASGGAVRASATQSNATGRADAAGSGAPTRASRLPPSGAPSRASASTSDAPASSRVAGSSASGAPTGAASPTRPPPSGSGAPRSARERVSSVPRRTRSRPASEDLSDMAKAYAVSAESSRPVRSSQPPAAKTARPSELPPSGSASRPSQLPPARAGGPARSGAPTVPPPHVSRPPLSAAARLSRSAPEPKLGAAEQILLQAEAAYAAGNTAEVTRHLKLLSAMTFDDPRTQARFAELKNKVYRTVAIDFEKQAAYEEKQQHWSLAAQSWLRVAEGRPGESLPLQRAVLAQLQAGVELRVVMETAKRALELGPNDAQAHRVMAKVYVAADMQANARRELEAAQRCSRAEGGDDLSPTGLLKRLLGREDKD